MTSSVTEIPEVGVQLLEWGVTLHLYAWQYVRYGCGENSFSSSSHPALDEPQGFSRGLLSNNTARLALRVPNTAWPYRSIVILLLSIGCLLIHEYSANSLLCATTDSTLLLLSTWLNSWNWEDHNIWKVKKNGIYYDSTQHAEKRSKHIS